jgi:hypothetical protein
MNLSLLDEAIETFKLKVWDRFMQMPIWARVVCGVGVIFIIAIPDIPGPFDDIAFSYLWFRLIHRLSVSKPGETD